jgi:hypothetical protein
MLIGFILTVWFVWAALFCLGLCAAAARPMPQPDAIEKVEMLQPINCQV